MSRSLYVMVDLTIPDDANDEAVADVVMDLLASVGENAEACAAFDELIETVNGTDWDRTKPRGMA